MPACRNCEAEVAASAWKCEKCGSYYANGSMIAARVAIGVILVGFVIAFAASA